MATVMLLPCSQAESGAGLRELGHKRVSPDWPAAGEPSLVALVTVRLKYFTTSEKNSHCFSHFCD